MKLTYRLESGYQLSTAVFYIPLDWGVARGDQMPVGARVGSVETIETYGLINSPCSQALDLTIDLFNATIDPSRTLSFSDTDEPPSIASTPGSEPGTGGYVFSETSDGFGTQDFAEDKDGNGLLDAVDHYPEFLSTTFPETQPIARLAGVATVAGVPVLLQFLIFAPGIQFDADGDLGQAMAEFPQSGYPALVVVQDFSNPDDARQPSPITDYCAPRDTSLKLTSLGDGPPLLVNPQAGSYGFLLVAFGKRDADGDGYENSLDTCPFDPNTGDPTVLNDGDADGDGMDAACDPNNDVLQAGANLDEDGDGYLNRQDNCPLVVNGDWSWGEAPNPLDNQTDVDFDDIGDFCDPNPESPDGEALVAVKTADVIVGDSSGSGGPPKADACPHCYQLGDAISESEAEGEGGQLAVAVGLIGVGAGAATVVVGSGALYLLRRRRN